MQIDISGHHCEVTDSLSSYVNEKLTKLENHFDKVIGTHVILTVEKHIQKAEATIQLSGQTIFASAENDDMYAAIDSLADKLDKQVIKYKEKLKHHR